MVCIGHFFVGGGGATAPSALPPPPPLPAPMRAMIKGNVLCAQNPGSMIKGNPCFALKILDPPLIIADTYDNPGALFMTTWKVKEQSL